MAALYDLTGKLKLLYTMAEDDEIDNEAIKDTLEAVDGEFDEKCANIGRVIRSLEADAEEINNEARRLADKKRSVENRVKWLKNYMMENMKEAGKSQAGDAVTKIRIVKNGGKLPLIFEEGLDAEDIPSKYQKVTYDVDKDEVRAALDKGVELPFAHYGERGESLRIK